MPEMPRFQGRTRLAASKKRFLMRLPWISGVVGSLAGSWGRISRGRGVVGSGRGVGAVGSGEVDPKNWAPR